MGPKEVRLMVYTTVSFSLRPNPGSPNMDVSSVLLRFRLLRLRRKNMRNAMRERIASPPTTPPATAAVVIVVEGASVAPAPAAPAASAELLGEPSPAVV